MKLEFVIEVKEKTTKFIYYLCGFMNAFGSVNVAMDLFTAALWRF
jgi:hypothetical protein